MVCAGYLFGIRFAHFTPKNPPHKPQLSWALGEKSLKGLRFYRKSISAEKQNGYVFFFHGTIESSHSDFNYIFSPIFSFFEEKYVLNDQFPIFDANHGHKILDHYESYILQNNENYIVASGLILKMCGKAIPEFDGNVLVVSSTQPPKMTWEEFKKYGQEIRHNTFCILANWDGIYWEIYTNEMQIFDKLIAHHSSDFNLEMYHVESEMDYPYPSRKRAYLKRVENTSS